MHGVELLGSECAVVVVIDVLSFSTSTDVVVGRGGSVLPQRMSGGPVPPGAMAAGPRDGSGPSLRPSSLVGLAGGTLIALPSPNGATLCAAAAAHDAVVLVGCLRNAPAVAAAALAVGGPIGLVAAGERWPDGTLRVAVEDAIGAGAIAAHLPDRSPEADLAVAQFTAAAADLRATLAALSSGRELVADGYGADVDLAAAHAISEAVPRLVNGTLTAAS